MIIQGCSSYILSAGLAGRRRSWYMDGPHTVSSMDRFFPGSSILFALK